MYNLKVFCNVITELRESKAWTQTVPAYTDSRQQNSDKTEI